MMEVSGVLMSWETLVISSVRKRSLFMRSFTARLMPVPMLLRSSACSLNTPRIFVLSTLYPSLPEASSFAPLRRLFVQSRAYSSSATSTARSRNHQNSSAPTAYSVATMTINSTNSSVSTAKPQRPRRGMPRSSLTKPRQNILNIFQHQRRSL